jgi:hypothetical protein
MADWRYRARVYVFLCGAIPAVLATTGPVWYGLKIESTPCGSVTPVAMERNRVRVSERHDLKVRRR